MLAICRVKCSECDKTHAVLPSPIVPYSQIPHVSYWQVISSLNGSGSINSVCDNYPEVSENNVKLIIRRYRKHWKERLLSFHISLIGVCETPEPT